MLLFQGGRAHCLLDEDACARSDVTFGETNRLFAEQPTDRASSGFLIRGSKYS